MRTRNVSELEFLQAVQEIVETVIPFISYQEIYNSKNTFLRTVEPEKAITFLAPW